MYMWHTCAHVRVVVGTGSPAQPSVPTLLLILLEDIILPLKSLFSTLQVCKQCNQRVILFWCSLVTVAGTYMKVWCSQVVSMCFDYENRRLFTWHYHVSVQCLTSKGWKVCA